MLIYSQIEVLVLRYRALFVGYDHLLVLQCYGKDMQSKGI